ncbi:uncharacterized protein DUF1206 [Nocardia tenerifensis]|uniref:Uncharacterized protein DUF1206 n=1 Tax=Nocardia tenerifensis TaxID=228006 RepID=A0A318KFU3_9NOCA|nr:DUF1206 domain-containing protein [Nocardia tenerifensis]PXX71112.1 uncharacterized protein DUF1206 [Nocardia tenerifensis]
MSIFRSANRYRRHDRVGTARGGRWRSGWGRRGADYRGRRSAGSGGLETAARFGFIARGIAYLTIGIIGFMLAIGTAEHEPDGGGALAAIASKPLGYLLLWVLLFGFAALVVWRVTQIAGARRTYSGGHRFYAVISGIVYALAFLGTFRYVVHGRTPKPSDAIARDLTARILGWDGGQVVVILIGLAIIAFGIWQTVLGLSLEFVDHLRMGWMTHGSREAVIWLGRIGYVARGAIVFSIGLAAVIAGLNYDPAEAEGIDAVLRDFVGKPFGPWLLILISLGLMAFGILSFLEAKHRRTYGGVPV